MESTDTIGSCSRTIILPVLYAALSWIFRWPTANNWTKPQAKSPDFTFKGIVSFLKESALNAKRIIDKEQGRLLRLMSKKPSLLFTSMKTHFFKQTGQNLMHASRLKLQLPIRRHRQKPLPTSWLRQRRPSQA